MDDQWKIPLQRFYSEPAKLAFAFQMEVLKWFQKLRDTELWIPCEDTMPIADHTSRVFTIVESDTECMADPPSLTGLIL